MGRWDTVSTKFGMSMNLISISKWNVCQQLEAESGKININLMLRKHMLGWLLQRMV